MIKKIGWMVGALFAAEVIGCNVSAGCKSPADELDATIVAPPAGVSDTDAAVDDRDGEFCPIDSGLLYTPVDSGQPDGDAKQTKADTYAHDSSN